MSIMNVQTKTLLKLSIKEFKAAEPSRQTEMIKYVERQLKNADCFAGHYVQAGRIFLRIFKPRELFTVAAYGFRAEAVKEYTGTNYNVFITVSKNGKALYSHAAKHTDNKTELIKETLTWMRENRPGQPVKYSDFDLSILNMCRDQVASINNEI